MLGERLFPLIQAMHRDLAGKITGMLLEIDNSELIHMLESGESLRAKVTALASLCTHEYLHCCTIMLQSQWRIQNFRIRGIGRVQSEVWGGGSATSHIFLLICAEVMHFCA